MKELKSETQTLKHSQATGQARWLAKAAILAAFSIVLMYLEFNLPWFPVFLKFDFAEIPALLGAFSLGPFAGLMIELVKNLSHLPFSHTGFTGELANFLICGSFVWVAGLIYKSHKTKRSAIIAMLAATLTMTVMGVVVNYYINIPFYIKVMGLDLDQIIGLVRSMGNTMVTDMKSLLLWVFVPFNLLKGFVISLLVALVYKRLSPLLHR